MVLRTTWLRVALLLGVSILLTLFLVRPMRAQVLYGSVTGTVTDQSGAVVLDPVQPAEIVDPDQEGD